MFGYVNAYWKELSDSQQERYRSVYCGICRKIRQQSSGLSALSLSYDMAFLALLLMSLYEPEEIHGAEHCLRHPVKKHPWTENPFVSYAADMNVALAYYNCLDDWHDDGSLAAGAMVSILGKQLKGIEEKYPRQCAAIRDCITRLTALERANCPNPDEPANCFGRLMGELLVYEEDLWATYLRQMGMALGRFIYLLDAAVDYSGDKRKGKYNPWLAMGMEEDWPRWEEYLVLAMGCCTASYEKLPLVQDKPLLDNILYSGVWVGYRRKGKEEKQDDPGSV